MMILATRGRPLELIRFINAYYETKARAKVLIYVDEDDPALPDYKLISSPAHWDWITGARLQECPTFNFVFKNFPDEPYYGLIADDIVPLTEHWDEILIEKAGRDGLAWGDDKMCGDNIATHPVIGGDLVRAAGFITYDGLKQYFADTWWTVIAKQMGVARYCPEVVIEHLHHAVNKAPVDQTYRDKWQFADTDRKIFDGFVNDQARVDDFVESLKRGLVLQRAKANEVPRLRD